jgi:hypothetical protein
MSAWPTLTAEQRAGILSLARGAGATDGGRVSVNLSPREWAAMAAVLETVDALGPVVADVARWDWVHGEECAHGLCPDMECDGTAFDCEANGRACDCSAGDVGALLDALRTLVKP